MAIRTTEEQREKVGEALAQPNAGGNEVVWTFFVADLIDRSPLRAQHIQRLFGGEERVSEPWFEAKPISPRRGDRGETEGNSRIDLAAGDIQQRGSTASGIEPTADASWVGFVEAKLLSDCSATVTHDPLRNQLTRVIENLLCFQAAGRQPERLYFSLLTPRYLRDNRRARLYGYKFDEYDRDRRAILQDIKLCPIRERNDRTWAYPVSLEDRASKLRLHWAIYEDIFDAEPDLKGWDLMKFATDGDLPEAVRSRLHDVLAE